MPSPVIFILLKERQGVRKEKQQAVGERKLLNGSEEAGEISGKRVEGYDWEALVTCPSYPASLGPSSTSQNYHTPKAAGQQTAGIKGIGG